MRRALFVLADVFAGAVLVLLLIDPTRYLGPVFVLLALAVGCAGVAWLVRRKQG
jgi:hypothetical protein